MLKHTKFIGERDTLRGNAIEILLYLFIYLFIYRRASVASETLTGVKMKKSGMFVYLFIYIYVWTYVCHFVL